MHIGNCHVGHAITVAMVVGVRVGAFVTMPAPKEQCLRLRMEAVHPYLQLLNMETVHAYLQVLKIETVHLHLYKLCRYRLGASTRARARARAKQTRRARA